MSLLTAGEMAKKYSVTPRALRLYVDKSLLKPIRSGDNTRLYNEEDERRMILILKARALGFSLRDISYLSRMKKGDVSADVDLNDVVPRPKIEEHLSLIRQQRDNMLVVMEQLQGYLDALSPRKS